MTQSLPPPSGNRSRGSSNASMNRYVPENYGNGPPSPRPSTERQGYGRPRGPSLENQQIPSIPPYPTLLYPGQLPNMEPPRRERQYSGGANQRPPYPSDIPSDTLRPPMEGRRKSNASDRSRHSQDSRRSHRSNDSRRSQRSRHSSSPDDREKRSYDHPRENKYDRSQGARRDHSGRDLKPPKRVDSHRPTWGDTIYGIFGAIRTSLSGSDR